MTTYTVEITVYDPNAAATVVKYFATHGFATESGDTPASTYFDGRLSQPATLRRRAFDGGQIGGRAKPAYGDLVLLNGDGALDGWIDYGLDSRRVVVRRGEIGDAYPGSWTTILDATMDGVPEVTETEVRIRIRDQLAALDVPLQTTKYDGDNVLPAGLEGTADDLKGKPKPVCYGQVRGIAPPCVNTSKLIYQVNDGVVDSIDAVYDRGVALAEPGPLSMTFNNVSVMAGSRVNAVAYGNGLFVAGLEDEKIATSPDGVNWTMRTSNWDAARGINDAAYSEDLALWVAVGGGITNGNIATSPDGIVWTQRTSPFTTGIQGVAWGNSVFVAVASGGQLATSSDGVAWTIRTSSFGATVIWDVVWGEADSLFVAVGASGKLATSADGISWTQQTSSFSTTQILCVTYGDGIFVAGGGSGLVGKIATSPDGTTWTQQTNSLADVYGLTYYRGTFLATDASTAVATSDDSGVTWSAETVPYSAGTGSLFDAVVGDGVLVVCGTVARMPYAQWPGIIYTSEADTQDDDLAPAPGAFGAYLAGGLFRLGSTPAGQITADVTQGDDASDRTHGQVWANILTDRASVSAGSDPGDYASADVTALDSATSAVIGYWTDQETTILAALDEVAQSAGAWWGADRSGVYRIQQLAAPSGSPDITLTEHEMLAAPTRARTNDEGRGIPRWKTILRYQRNYTVQTTDLAAGVSDARRARLAKEWLETSSEDSTVQTKHPLAPQIIETCLLDTAANAATEVARRQTLFGTRRDRFTVPVPLNDDTDELDLGDVIALRFPRYALSVEGNDDGALFRVLGVEPDAAAETMVLDLWGSALTERNIITYQGAFLVTDTGSYLLTAA